MEDSYYVRKEFWMDAFYGLLKKKKFITDILFVSRQYFLIQRR